MRSSRGAASLMRRLDGDVGIGLENWFLRVGDLRLLDASHRHTNFTLAKCQLEPPMTSTIFVACIGPASGPVSNSTVNCTPPDD